MHRMEESSPNEATSSHWIAPLCVAGIVCTFGLLKAYGFHHAAWDDNIYFYLAERINESVVPYRDFDHAHPPLHLLTISLLYRLTGGFSLFASRLLPMLACALTGVFLYRLLRRQDVVVAVVACGVYLFSYHILRISTHLDGANLATLWLCIGLERLVRSRDVQAASFFVVGGFTLFNAIPAAVGAWAVIFVLDRRRGVRLAVLGFALFALAVAVTVAIVGMEFFDQVIGYHLGKSVKSDSLASTLHNALRLNPWLVGASALGVVGLILRPAKARTSERSAWANEIELRLPLYLALGAGIASLLFLGSLAKVFSYYLTPLLLCMAPLAAFGLVSLAEQLRAVARSREREAMTATLILGAFFIVTQAPALSGFFAGEGASTPREWKASGFAPSDAIVRPLLWRNSREPGARYLAWTHYLWAEASHFSEASEIADAIQARGDDGDTLFGDSLAAPLVALLADRKIAFEIADTNYMRFEHKPDSLAKTLARLDAAPPRFVIRRPTRGFSKSAELREWLSRHYTKIETFRGESGARVHELFIRR